MYDLLGLLNLKVVDSIYLLSINGGHFCDPSHLDYPLGILT